MDKSLTESESFRNNKSMEAIMALNIGDFVAEHFISEDLLGKINLRIANDPGKLVRQLEELIEIYSVDKTLGLLGGLTQSQSPSGVVLYDDIAQTLCDMLQVNACHIFKRVTSRDASDDYLMLVGTSLDEKGLNHESITIPIQSKNVVLGAYLESRTMVLEPGGKDRLDWHPIATLHQDKVKTFMATPLSEGRKRFGLILFESYQPCSFGPELFALAEATARTFVTATRLHQLLETSRRELARSSTDANELINLRAQVTENIADLGINQQEFLEALSNAIDARNHFTRGHSKCVAEISRNVAEAMALNEKTVDLVYYAGLMSALGKMNLPQELMAKKEQLTSQERQQLKSQPQEGVDFLSRMNFLSEMLPYLQSAQERWDGTGEPEKLSGKSIPLGSRILAVADAYYSMTRERPYRETPLTHEEAMANLHREAGSKWDPSVVDALSKISVDSLL